MTNCKIRKTSNKTEPQAELNPDLSGACARKQMLFVAQWFKRLEARTTSEQSTITSLQNCIRRSQKHRSRGMAMVEIVFSIMLVGGLVVVALNTVVSSVMGRQITSDHNRGHLLAQELMSEILQRDYRENFEINTFGRELGETDGTRLHFDDVDDYDDWVASPPQTKDGTEYTDLTGWQRSVIVNFVSPTDFTMTSLENTGVKRIDVNVEHHGEITATLQSIRTKSYAIGKALRSD